MMYCTAFVTSASEAFRSIAKPSGRSDFLSCCEWVPGSAGAALAPMISRIAKPSTEQLPERSRLHFERLEGLLLIFAEFSDGIAALSPVPNIHFLASIFHSIQTSRTPGKFACQFQKAAPAKALADLEASLC